MLIDKYLACFFVCKLTEFMHQMKRQPVHKACLNLLIIVCDNRNLKISYFNRQSIDQIFLISLVSLKLLFLIFD